MTKGALDVKALVFPYKGFLFVCFFSDTFQGFQKNEVNWQGASEIPRGILGFVVNRLGQVHIEITRYSFYLLF